MTLGAYVLRRNGVPLGHSKSLQMMLTRSFGAGSYAEFWRYWNPIWSYYLSRYIHRPLHRVLSRLFTSRRTKSVVEAIAVLATFAISGLLHDAAIFLFSGTWPVICLSWFSLMGGLLVASEAIGIHYGRQPMIVRCVANALPTSIALVIVLAWVP